MSLLNSSKSIKLIAYRYLSSPLTLLSINLSLTSIACLTADGNASSSWSGEWLSVSLILEFDEFVVTPPTVVNVSRSVNLDDLTDLFLWKAGLPGSLNDSFSSTNWALIVDFLLTGG
jgi:hypothetical protein